MPPCRPPYTGQKATAFPLIPFGGRIRAARLHWNGGVVELPCHPPESPHICHGDGARRAWEMTESNRHSARMTCTWPSKSWPFAARCEQVFAVTDDAFRIRQSVTSNAGEPIPFGLGWHPYFLLAPQDRLSLSANRIAALDGEGFADAFEALSGWHSFQPARSPGSSVFELVSHEVHLQGVEARLTIRLDPIYRYLVVHVPPAADAVAIEPMSHLLHEPQGAILQPGETAIGNIEVCAAP